VHYAWPPLFARTFVAIQTTSSSASCAPTGSRPRCQATPSSSPRACWYASTLGDAYPAHPRRYLTVQDRTLRFLKNLSAQSCTELHQTLNPATSRVISPLAWHPFFRVFASRGIAVPWLSLLVRLMPPLALCFSCVSVLRIFRAKRSFLFFSFPFYSFIFLSAQYLSSFCFVFSRFGCIALSIRFLSPKLQIPIGARRVHRLGTTSRFFQSSHFRLFLTIPYEENPIRKTQSVSYTLNYHWRSTTARWMSVGAASLFHVCLSSQVLPRRVGRHTIILQSKGGRHGVWFYSNE